MGGKAKTGPVTTEQEGVQPSPGPFIWISDFSLPTECPNKEMDIAFLIDGSGSIDQSDFNQMKGFVKAVMDQFKDTNTLVNAGH